MDPSMKTLEQRRLEFDAELRALLETQNTYYEPPANVRISYPCVVYSRSSIEHRKADDRRYQSRIRYMVTVISTNPDNEWPQLLLEHFPYARYDRHYNADGLSHDVVTIYY